MFNDVSLSGWSESITCTFPEIQRPRCLHEARRDGMTAHPYQGLDPSPQPAYNTISYDYHDLRR